MIYLCTFLFVLTIIMYCTMYCSVYVGVCICHVCLNLWKIIKRLKKSREIHMFFVSFVTSEFFTITTAAALRCWIEPLDQSLNPYSEGRRPPSRWDAGPTCRQANTVSHWHILLEPSINKFLFQQIVNEPDGGGHTWTWNPSVDHRHPSQSEASGGFGLHGFKQTFLLKSSRGFSMLGSFSLQEKGLAASSQSVVHGLCVDWTISRFHNESFGVSTTSAWINHTFHKQRPENVFFFIINAPFILHRKATHIQDLTVSRICWQRYFLLDVLKCFFLSSQHVLRQMFRHDDARY